MSNPSELLDDDFGLDPKKPTLGLLIGCALFFGMLAFYLSVSLKLLQYDAINLLQTMEGARTLSPNLMVGILKFNIIILVFAILNLICSFFYLKKSNNRFNGICYFGGFLGALAIILCFIPASLFL